VEAGIDGGYLGLQCLHIFELSDSMVTNHYLGLFAINECPPDVVISFGSNIPNLVLIGISFALEDGEFASGNLLWSQFTDLFQQRLHLEWFDDDGKELE
jgi:hypothetical protein